MNPASSEARNGTAWATSQAVPIRRRGGPGRRRCGGARQGRPRHAPAIPSIAIGVSMSPGRTAFTRIPWRAPDMASWWVRALHRRLGRLVGQQRHRADRRHRRDVDDRPRALGPHDGQHVLARHPRALEVDVVDQVPVLGEPGGAGVTGADPDVVDQHVDAPVAVERGGGDGAAVGLVGDVGPQRPRPAPGRFDQVTGLHGRGEVPVDRHHLRSLRCQLQGGGPAVADGVARGLARSDDHRHPVRNRPGPRPVTSGSRAPRRRAPRRRSAAPCTSSRTGPR